MLNWCPHSLFLFDSDAFDFEYGTVLLRINEGLDVSHIVEAEGQFEKSCISITVIFMKYFFKQGA